MTQPETRAAFLGREHVRVSGNGETVSGYTAGWVARVDGVPVGLLRAHPSTCNADLLAWHLRDTSMATRREAR